MSTATTAAEVKTYNLLAPTGNHVRKATMVVFADGFTVKFTERMTQRSAREQAAHQRAKSEYRVDNVLITTAQLKQADRFEESVCPECAAAVGVHLTGKRVTVIEQTCDCVFDRSAVEAVVEDLEIQFAGDNLENYSDGKYLGRHYNQFTF